ncbi:PLC-like phosphodiesterase [Serendipita vermifera]|nr:PLC-like phosphodiesterase [Serendipita vermifera]
MSTYPDETLVQNLSIAGTHDSLTWNIFGVAAPFVQTQDLSLFDQLNNGVRFVDLRIGILSGKIRLYHSSYLLSSKAELVDIFWGLYHWLDLHPTETILVSMKVDNGNNTVALRQQVYDLMNGEQKGYWVRNTTLPNLGQARRKLIPILRMRLDQMDVGINFSSGWSDNKASISIQYAYDSDGTVAQTVYIEDLYNPQADSEEEALDAKFNALMVHFNSSTSRSVEERMAQWYIAFASGYNGILTTPEDFAWGSEILPTKTIGINTRLLQLLKSNQGSYFGVIMYDYLGRDLRLVNATLGLTISFSNFARKLPSVLHLSLFGSLLATILHFL